jgi:hypothetical protein
MDATRVWLPNPPDGTSVAGGFDGSENDDWTAIKLETRAGLIFTPRYGPDRRPTVWKPREWGGRIPRSEVHAAWEEINRRFHVVRAYCDPGFRDEVSWESEIEAWDQLYGPKVFIPWQMAGNSRINAVYAALRRFEADLKSGLITHDGCPLTSSAMANARKIAKSAERYGLGKPAQPQKIDAAVTAVLAHEAASDARAAGWPVAEDSYSYFV